VPPLRLLFLNTRLSIGGPAKVTTSLAETLAARGHEVVLAGGEPEPGEEPDPRAAAARVPLRRVAGLRRPVRPLADLAALARVRSLLRDLRPDVLITTGSKSGALGRLAARLVRPRPRTVHVFHGHVFRGHFGKRAGRLFASVEKRLARITDDLVAVCASVEEDLRALGLHERTRLHRVEIGYDLGPLLVLGPPCGEFQQELGLPPEMRLVVCPARVCPVKNQALVIEAVARAGEALPPDQVRVLFVGDGVGVEALEALARELGVDDRVHFVGYRERMEAVYRDAELVVLASRSEAIPMSLIEAAAAGRPFVATAVGGIPELHRERLGRLVPSDDAEALGRALAETLGPGSPDRLPDELRIEVAQRFSPERFADEVEGLLEEGRK
jgi:glycosyltransferase involved in cell wall biosynthesis